MTAGRVSRRLLGGGDPEPTERVRVEWRRRIEAEYRSAALAQHLTLWLIQAGLSPDLVAAGLRVVRDELAHARLSRVAYRAAGGREPPSIARETLALPVRDGEPLEMSIARAGVEVFCLGETVAVPLFKVLRDGCTVPAARAVLDRVLRDEVRHRDFGWLLLEHLLELPFGHAVRALVARELPQMFARLRDSYAPEAAAGLTTTPPEERAWGLMAPARYGAILERAVERDYVPRFAGLGIDARAAWASAITRPGPSTAC